MAIYTLEREALEDGTYIITLTFADADGEPVTPKTLSWTLTDTEGVVINGRENVALTPAAEVNVLLKGDDLDPGDSLYAELLFTISGTYDSDLGSDLPIKAQVKLPLQALLP